MQIIDNTDIHDTHPPAPPRVMPLRKAAIGPIVPFIAGFAAGLGTLLGVHLLARLFS